MLSTGVDIVQVNRIEKLLRDKEDKFLKKIFTQNEVQYIKEKQKDPRTIAGIFAAKEAVAKALGTGIGEISWQDMEIIHDSRGKPRLNINKKLANLLRKGKHDSIELSISHEKEYAVAFAITFRNLN